MKYGFLAGIAVVLSLASAAMADEPVMFNYQGRIRVQGQPFSGAGQFKFAILNTSATATLWSNDGTGTGGAEPTGYTPLTLTDGVFNVLIGDPSAGMQPINGAIFNTHTPLKLRTWFCDGTLGFEQLNPDNTLVDLTLLTINSQTSDFTIYVNGGTGNDANNGLSPASAKKTIQAAVDMLPSKLRCNVTVDIANGVYRERVVLAGVNMTPGKKLTLLGDETWTGASGSPAVRITGTDQDSSPLPVRDYCLHAVQCTGMKIRGILCDYSSWDSLEVQNGTYEIEYCKTANNEHGGFVIADQTFAVVRNCLSELNVGHGIRVSRNSYADLYSCTASDNMASGVCIEAYSGACFRTSASCCYNDNSGIVGSMAAGVMFDPALTGSCTHNSQYGIELLWNSWTANFYSHSASFSFNTLGASSSSYGSGLY